MGYFSNGTEGDMYIEKYCCNCINYGGEYDICPVWGLHLDWNGYDDKQFMLDELIPRDKDGYNLQCTMFISPETIRDREQSDQQILDKKKLDKWNKTMGGKTDDT